MTIVVLGIDLGKNCCSVAGLDEEGRVVMRKQLGRGFLDILTIAISSSRIALSRSLNGGNSPCESLDRF